LAGIRARAQVVRQADTFVGGRSLTYGGSRGFEIAVGTIIADRPPHGRM
jgi:hypothetical protein